MVANEGLESLFKPGPRDRWLNVPSEGLLSFWVRAEFTLKRKIPVASRARTWELYVCSLAVEPLRH